MNLNLQRAQMNTQVAMTLKLMRLAMSQSLNDEFKINPYKGYGNAPYMLLKKVPPNFDNCIYNFDAKEGCYWYQDKDSGNTDFLYHSGPIEYVQDVDVEVTEENKQGTLPLFQTKHNHDGYGGRTFRLLTKHPDLKDVVLVDVRGPWSGGCYCANKILPKPATEVTFWDYTRSPWSFVAGKLSLEAVNKLLEKYESRWKCILTNKLSSTVCPEFVYAEGCEEKAWDSRETWEYKEKEALSSQTIDALDVAWQKEWPTGDGFFKQMMVLGRTSFRSPGGG